MGMRLNLHGYSVVAILVLSAITVAATAPTLSYSDIKGFNYVPSSSVNDIDMWRNYNKTLIERELGWGKQMGFNFVRVFLNYLVWEVEGSAFLEKVKHFISTSYSYGIMVMPIPFDTCSFGCSQPPTYNTTQLCWFSSPGNTSLVFDRSWWPKAEAFAEALVKALPHGTPGLMLWDVHNEPDGDWDFVDHMVKYFKRITKTPTTVGVWDVTQLQIVAPYVDVLSFHSYHHDWQTGQNNYNIAKMYSEAYNKPVFNSETGCIARANSYDQVILLSEMNNMGWVIWELMISDCQQCADGRRWKHGLLYSDGAVRDTMGAAAVAGFFVKRSGDLAVPRIDVEGVASGTISSAEQWLIHPAQNGFDAGIQLADAMINMVESSGTVAVVTAPSYELQALKHDGNTADSLQQLVTLIRKLITLLAGVADGAQQGPGTCYFTTANDLSNGLQ